MSVSVCVVFSDIVAWTTEQNLSAQIATAQALFQTLVTKLELYGLTPVWKTSMGDGFAVALPRADAVRVLQLCADLHDEYVNQAGPALRLAMADGSVQSFINPLHGSKDYTGPAIVKTRRILDGITAGNVLLVDQHLAEDCRGQVPTALVSYFMEHPDISDKHGNQHHVVQVLSRLKERGEKLTVPPSATEWINGMKGDAVTATETALGGRLLTIDSLVVMWLDSDWGMEATALKVRPLLAADGSATALEPLPELSGKPAEYAARYWADAKAKFGSPNKPKVWLKKYRTPLMDRPALELELGRTDYWTARAIELACDQGDLRKEYETGTLDIHRDLPGTIGTHAVVVTIDGYLILSQRKGGEVDWAGGTYSPSFEEQWDPSCDRTPHDAVLRGLREEFNVDRGHDVHVTVDNLRLVALAREWGRFWNTVIVYLVKLTATAEKFLECWSAVPPPKDKNEHVAVVAVPLFKPTARASLQRLLGRGSKITLSTLETEHVAGTPSDGELHPSSGRARILIALSAPGVGQTE